jgi:hypothetical protein
VSCVLQIAKLANRLLAHPLVAVGPMQKPSASVVAQQCMLALACPSARQ